MKRGALVLGTMLLLLLASQLSAATASNSVPPSRLGLASMPLTADDVKPSACAPITVTLLIVGTGKLKGTSGNDLIVGRPGTKNIDGKDGDDCLVANASTKDVDGGRGYDICVLWPGTKHKGCEVVTAP